MLFNCVRERERGERESLKGEMKILRERERERERGRGRERDRENYLTDG